MRGAPQDVVAAVRSAATAQGFALEAGQECALAHLAGLAADLARPGPLGRGGYLWGPAGRGKTWLLDAWVAALPPGGVLRVHVHDLYVRLHARVGARSGTGGAFARALDDVLDGVRLLCLDELHLHDSDDTWMAQRLVARVLEGGGAVVATSNYPLDALLPSPLHHHHAEALIALLRGSTVDLPLGAGADHRTEAAAGQDRPGFASGAYLCAPTDAQLAALGLTVPGRSAATTLVVGGRALPVRADEGDRLWVSFAALCEGPTAPADYLALAATHRTWVLYGVPPLHERGPDPRQRFLHAVDVAYDEDVRLVLLTRTPLGDLFTGPDLAPDLARTRSRLALLDRR